jgi:arylsulfatase A-like enzyme
MSKNKPNLLFIFADQWRRQAVGCMNADPVITPHMDKFASEGIVFENALSCSPVCTPNRAALLTGKHPFGVNMMYNWLRLPVEEDTIAKALKRQGYDTGYIGKWHLDEWDGKPEYGNAWNCFTPAGERRVGFDFWYSNGCVHGHFDLKYMNTDNDIFEGEGWQVDHETDVALDYLRNSDGQRDGDKPFCLFLSWAPPHTHHGGYKFDKEKGGFQYAAPDEFEALYEGKDLPVPPNTNREMFLDAAPGYFGAVSSMDANFGRIIDALNELELADDTLVVLSADHGDCLGAHNKYIKDVWYEESIGIPLIARWPGQIPAGQREDILINTPDFMPSMLGLMDCEIPEGRHGRDLSAFWRGEGKDADRPTEAFLAFNAGAPPRELTKWDAFPDEPGRQWRAIKTERYTYVACARGQYGDPTQFSKPLPEGVKQLLIDNANDPWQVNPIYPGQGKDDVIEELHARLKTWLDDLGDPFLEEDWV